ncbi:MAG: hypothetical protein ABIE74_05580 [Pseudomonadota bacterium]
MNQHRAVDVFSPCEVTADGKSYWKDRVGKRELEYMVGDEEKPGGRLQSFDGVIVLTYIVYPLQLTLC